MPPTPTTHYIVTIRRADGSEASVTVVGYKAVDKAVDFAIRNRGAVDFTVRPLV